MNSNSSSSDSALSHLFGRPDPNFWVLNQPPMVVEVQQNEEPLLPMKVENVVPQLPMEAAVEVIEENDVPFPVEDALPNANVLGLAAVPQPPLAEASANPLVPIIVKSHDLLDIGVQYFIASHETFNGIYNDYAYCVVYDPEQIAMYRGFHHVPPTMTTGEAGIVGGDVLFVQGLDDAKAKYEALTAAYPSKSVQELEDEAFEHTMCGGEIPERPNGFGLGVRKSDIYGVHGVLRKQGYGKVQKRTLVMENVKQEVSVLNKKNETLEKENGKLKEQVQENNFLLKTLITQFSELVCVVRKGNTSAEVLDCFQ